MSPNHLLRRHHSYLISYPTYHFCYSLPLLLLDSLRLGPPSNSDFDSSDYTHPKLPSSPSLLNQILNWTTTAERELMKLYSTRRFNLHHKKRKRGRPRLGIIITERSRRGQYVVYVRHTAPTRHNSLIYVRLTAQQALNELLGSAHLATNRSQSSKLKSSSVKLDSLFSCAKVV